MEELAGEGYFRGVIDFTTNEVTDPLVGGIHDGGPHRLRVVGELGLPQVVVPGCIDFAVFEPTQVPAALADRPSYDHNPEFRLIRTSAEEMLTIAGIFAERLGAATGPVRVAVPTQGCRYPMCRVGRSGIRRPTPVSGSGFEPSYATTSPSPPGPPRERP
jgi:uncharacterized protein (UPF0261 family)